MFKTAVLLVIGVLLWTNNDARTVIADGLQTAEEFVRPEPESLSDRINELFN